MRLRQRALVLGAALTVSACMANPPIAVAPGGGPARSGARQAGPGPGMHTVARGENLYRIALEHGLDFRAIAQWNGIPQPYVIHPGQQLRLTPPATAQPVPAVREVPPRAPPSAPPSSRPADAFATLPAPTPLPPSVPRTGGTPPPPVPVSAPPRPAPAALPAPAPPSAGRWQWPVRGRTVRAYSHAHGGNKGVDLAAARGAPVWATADGTVVYVGDGLKQYGNLIIVKHGEEYLSAYGHLDDTLVAEGAPVRKGQPIARVGGPASEGLLHFEIRRRGEPVDPAGLVGRLN